MVTQSWLYDTVIYIYALSLLFYFSDVVGPNRSAKRMGTGLLSFVWVLQTAYLGYGLVRHDVSATFTMLETLFFFSWFLVTLALIAGRFMRIELFVFFVNVFGFAVLALHMFSNPLVKPSLGNWKISDELLFIHITLAIASYTAYTAAAIFSGMYLFLHRKLKEKQWSSSMKRLPSLEVTDKYTMYAVVIGTPLLLTSLILGIVWVWLQGEAGQLLDPKVVNSFFVLAAYTFYLFQRRSMGINGKKLAVWNLIAFAIVVLNFAVSNFYSQFHGWTG